MKRILFCFTITLVLGLGASARATVTGQWDFNSSNLVATTGTDLAYRGDTQTGTTFTTKTIGGSNAIVMAFPATATNQGYVMTHRIAPNGGGSRVNRYTLIMDVMFPRKSLGGFIALWQTDPDNLSDGDLFVNGAGGIGISSEYSGSIVRDTWHRVACVFDLTLTETNLLKYIDGIQVGTQTLYEGLDLRWSLGSTALLFADDDGETAAGFVNSIQIHDTALSANDIFSLGGATAAGIPPTIPGVTNVAVIVTPTSQTAVAGMAATPFTASAAGSGTLSYQWYLNGVAVPGQTTPPLVLSNVQSANAGSYTVIVNNGTQFATSSPPAVLTVEPAPPTFMTGQWDFNQGDLRATLGQPLQYFDATVQSDTSFGTTTSLGVGDLAGQPANVMFCNPSTIGVTNWGGFIMTHGMAPNGGGTNVNQYTVILDLFYINWTSGFYRALWQTTPQNTNDADAFISPGNGLGISQQYDGELILDNWHRIILTFDLTRREFGKYIDGTNVLAAPTGDAPRGPHHVQYLDNDPDPTAGGDLDMRWSLGPTALLLADGLEDGEVQPVYVSSVQVRSGRMTDAAIAALGAPTAGKIPGFIKATRSGNSVVIDWTGAVLESASNVATGSWSEVTGAAHPHVVTAPTDNRFFRVKR